MASFETSFHPFVFVLKIFALEKIEIKTKKFNFAPTLYFVLVLLTVVLVLLLCFLDAFAANADGSHQAFLLMIFAIDSFFYVFVSTMFYANIPRRRKYFRKVMSLMKKFDLIASGHGIDLNYRKLNYQAKAFLLSTFFYLIYALISDIIFKSKSFFYNIRLVISFIIYYIYIVELKLYVFLLWNVFIRHESLHLKLQELKFFNNSVPQDRFMLFNVLGKVVGTIIEGFSWNFSLIFRKYSNVRTLCSM